MFSDEARIFRRPFFATGKSGGCGGGRVQYRGDAAERAERRCICRRRLVRGADSRGA
jgi:hypothetical protein